MENLQHILDRMKDSDGDKRERTSQKKTQLKKINHIDKSLPFSDEEMQKLEYEMLGCDSKYKEPIFKDTKEMQPNVYENKKVSDTPSKETLYLLKEIQKNISNINDKIFINQQLQETKSSNFIESIQPIELVKLMINQVDNKDEAYYQIQTEDDVKLIPLKEYYDISQFINMLEQYQYSFIVDKKLNYENVIFKNYKDKLIIISQNLLANSFKFFEKSTIIDEILIDTQNIISTLPSTRIYLEPLMAIFKEMRIALDSLEYKKQFFFAKLLNDRDLILNAILTINEMLSEYIIDSSRELSQYAEQRIQNHIDNITLTQTTRKAYYKFYKSSRDFFRSNFSKDETLDKLPFFPKQDNGNEEIKNKMNRLYRSNKMNKSHYFIQYTELIEKVRAIRNDLAHGNISKIHNDISKDIDEILIDFQYLAIDKDFLSNI